MFPTDIIAKIVCSLSYSDYISLISTCSDYYNNKYIRSKRRNRIISKHSNLIDLLYLSININDIEMVQSIMNSQKLSSLPGGFLKFLINNSNYQIFKIIESNFKFTCYLPEAFKGTNIRQINESEKGWDYVLNIIKRDREDIMSCFLKNYERKENPYFSGDLDTEITFAIFNKCLEYSAYKCIPVMLKNDHLDKKREQIDKLIFKELEKQYI